ncbi:hypothetical protein Taro_047915 [Colocasia esculenta]|uniref:Uncharacterized protein n=1 Tax=Colocasia esculenta TaxID=4460 RepID=A0A843X822_COLES|nr:hypothetical protein [Colocasia esculenta]
MASVCARSTRCASMSSLRSFLKPSAAPAPRRAGTVLAGTAPPAAESSGASARRSAAGARFSSLSRSVSFGTGLLLGVPAPAAQCGGGSEADVAPELIVSELQGSLTGYALPYLSRTLVLLLFSPPISVSLLLL